MISGCFLQYGKLSASLPSLADIQNVTEKLPLSVHKFWTIVCSATGALTAAGLVAALLFRHGETSFSNWRDQEKGRSEILQTEAARIDIMRS